MGLKPMPIEGQVLETYANLGCLGMLPSKSIAILIGVEGEGWAIAIAQNRA